ncbi:MAG: aminotransferase class V-fold PLP-dependent enzyme [Gemmatimonadaceae bacterium]
MSPLMTAVEAAGREGIARKRVPSSITPLDFFTGADEVRNLFTTLVHGGDPTRVAVVPAVSYAITTAVRNLKPRRGQNIVVLHEQFPSNVYPWRRLCTEHTLELRTVRPPDDPAGRGAEWNARLLAAIDDATLAVALEPVHWADGTCFDLTAVGDRARASGAAFIVDAIQAAGAMPLDIHAIRPDLLVAGAYKWLMGPLGVGVAYFGERFDGGTPLEESWLGRVGSEDFRHLVDYVDDYRTGAARYDAGGRANFILLPMFAAALRQLIAWTPAAIADYCSAITSSFVAEVRGLGYTVEDEGARAAHLFGIRAPTGVDLCSLQTRLAERHVVVSIRGNAIRVSPHVYNDESDLAALADVLRSAV